MVQSAMYRCPSIACTDENADVVNVNVNHIFSVAKWRKLLHRPRRRSVIKGQCPEKTGEKEMF